MGRPLALLYLDIDHFKRINDSLGHAAGDGVLREFASRLKSSLRATDFAARMGGDEFVALIEDVDDPEIPEIVARKMIEAMQAPILVEGNELQASASIGIAFCGRRMMGRENLLRIADGMLYEAKAAGRNTFRMAVVEDSDRSSRSGTA